ncbi:hypothetical protein BJ508DRAFT_169972 [Ascobolus immersus RN42]|uniref:Uncharacterized protein n=1 Tax=Ascobolus immersus RN42 TaxID=1160509 RepID=A0A3N4HYD7_ASCIM|nr:hypothetical protein BJ508DRAFT_169972 [Ascobolus immersus RN42]
MCDGTSNQVDTIACRSILPCLSSQATCVAKLRTLYIIHQLSSNSLKSSFPFRLDPTSPGISLATTGSRIATTSTIPQWFGSQVLSSYFADHEPRWEWDKAEQCHQPKLLQHQKI